MERKKKAMKKQRRSKAKDYHAKSHSYSQGGV
jgi:hypothetical protein